MMPERPIKITNAKVITPNKMLETGTLLINEGRITAVENGNPEAEDYFIIDARGQYLAPGFIDIHVHGGGGFDFMDADPVAFCKIAELHASFGTTSMLPTSLTSSREDILETLSVYKKAELLNTRGAQFLGFHLEGPYFAMAQRGAQDPRFIRNPDPDEYKAILSGSSVIKRWSAAPELPGALEFARYLRSKNILVSAAHTDAVYEQALEGFRNGYSLATHLYSGMSGVTRRNAFRYAGMVETAYLIDEMDVEIIADGAHLPAPLLELVYKIKGPDRTALVTDAMRATGTDVTESILGNRQYGLRVIVEDGVAKLPDRSSFAGSVATADRLVRTMNKLTGIPLSEVIKMITATPARILGVQDRKGSLSPGKDADLVIFDEDINIQMTIIKGKIVYDSSVANIPAKPEREQIERR